MQASVEVVLAKREYRQMLENKGIDELLDKRNHSANSVAREKEEMLSQQPQTQTQSSKIVSLLESDFDEEVLNAVTPVLVFVESSNGNVYSRIKPILDTLADEYENKLKIVFIDKLVTAI